MKNSRNRNFLSKICILTAMGLCISTIVIAGILTVISCDNCGYKSEDLYNGAGFAGVENTVVYCPDCKKFMTIPTKIHNQPGPSHEAKIAVSQGKEVFLGQECLVYSCPKCGKKAFDYRGKMCPICLKGLITYNVAGKWD